MMSFAKPLALAVMAAGLILPAAHAAEPDPFVGRWKMNPAKSHYVTGAQPREQIATISVSGKDLRVQVDGITSDGIKTVVSYSVPYDGGTGKMDLKSSPAYDGISGRHNGTYKREIARLKNGKPVFTAISTVSSDGKTMSVFSKGISPVGRPVEAHVVYDKLN